MNRRGFLRLLGLAPVALALPAVRRDRTAEWFEQAAREFDAYRRRYQWMIEWFERDFPWDGKTAYAVRATHKITGQVRAMGWRALTPGTREGRWQQRCEMKARMRAWALETLV